jgi:glycosyltransferase involved in cell wall biosynthesis
MIKLSIIIPVYNEKKFIGQVISQVSRLKCNQEMIVIDDCSTDGTLEELKKLSNKFDFRIFTHQRNQGKGAAIRTGLKQARGEYSIIYDADLEYSVQDIVYLLKEAEKVQNAQLSKKRVAIYGSRFLKKYPKKISSHYLANRFLTFLTNLFFNLKLTDMETCLKLCPTKILQGLDLKSKRFEFDPEVTAKLAKKGVLIVERPIQYSRRTYQQGKKIGFADGFSAVKTIFKEKIDSL